MKLEIGKSVFCPRSLVQMLIIIHDLLKQSLDQQVQIPGGFCAIHIIYHLMALTYDPADPNIRGGTKKAKAIFDRSQHQHVIENCHCYICQVDVQVFFQCLTLKIYLYDSLTGLQTSSYSFMDIIFLQYMTDVFFWQKKNINVMMFLTAFGANSLSL